MSPIERRNGIAYLASTFIQPVVVAAWYNGLPVEDGEAHRLSQTARMFQLDPDQTRFCLGYAAKKAAKKDPVVRERKVRGRAQKARGYAAERMFLDRYLGAKWERVPLSGALGGRHRGDVRYIGEGTPAVAVGEIKRREGAFKQWRAYLAQGGGVDFAGIVPGGVEPPLVVMLAETFKRLLERAGDA